MTDLTFLLVVPVGLLFVHITVGLLYRTPYRALRDGRQRERR